MATQYNNGHTVVMERALTGANGAHS